MFNNEFPQKSLKITFRKREYGISVFKLILFTTIFSFVFLIFKIPPPFSWDNWFINNSAEFIVLALTALLVIFFFVWLGKVALYNGKSKSLLTYLINNYNKTNADSEIQNYHLKAINELTFYAIKKQDEHLQKTLLEFYSTIFANSRKNHDKSEPLIYPIDLYLLVSKIIEISVENETKLRAIEHRAVSGIWLFGEDFENIKISRDTYSWLWGNIYIICNNPRLIKMFWAYSSQYFNNRLQAIHPNHDFDKKEILNKKDVDERDIERFKFLEFHYALGGLMLYREQYKTLKYMFEFSQSLPPKYILLPQTMTDIFFWFEIFSNEFKHRTPIDSIYYFPELDNLGNSRQVNYWICCYITTLFIRQYSLHQYYTFQNFTDQPYLPDEISELSNWLNCISHFERCLNNMISNNDLMTELGFEKLIETKKEDFILFINNLTNGIKDKIGQQKLNAELSEDKIKNFYSKSSNIISQAFDLYKSIFIEMDRDHLESEFKNGIYGGRTLMSKSAFTDKDVPHLNYDTAFAESIVIDSIKRFIPNSFFVAKTKRYLLNKNNILLALAKIIENDNNVIIIGVNIHYQLKDILEKSLFKSVVQYIPSTEQHTQDTLFVLRKKDLPAIEHKKINEEEINEFQLNSINKDLNLYASVIDINKENNNKIRDKWNLENEPNNQDLKVQLTIAFLSVLYWKDKREIIQINIASEYREQGIQNDLNDVKSLLRKKKKTFKKNSS